MTGPTGNLVADAFLAEVDARIAGTSGIGQPPWWYRRFLRSLRPVLRNVILANPAAFEKRLRENPPLARWIDLAATDDSATP